MINRDIGYYICNGLEFQSKIKCALYATEQKKPVQWVFNDSAFSKHTWTVEPDLTLDQLYDRRARELREKYDYLILSYSAGSDSHNILMSFYRQGLHIDEIVTNWVLDASKHCTVADELVTQAWNQNAEFELTVRPQLEWIRQNMPKTKITVYDCSKDILTYFLQARDESWVLDANGVLNPAVSQRFNYLNVKEVRNRVDHFNKLAVVTGTDKPRIWIQDGKVYLKFIDKIANITPINKHFYEYDNSTIEFFYWSPACCDMLAKQAHVVYKFLKANPQYQTLWKSEHFQVRETQEKILKKLIYTTWNSSWFQVEKPTLDWESELDLWFDSSKNRAYTNWQRGLDFVEQTLDPSFIKGRGFEICSSPLYYIGEL